MYLNETLQVKWDDITSRQFNVTNGVRQGGVLYPMLFSVYIDALLNVLESHGMGCCIGQKLCGAAGYADDIILLCPTSSGLRQMIDICEKYADLHDIIFNGTKSKVLVYYNKKVTDPHFKVNGNDVPNCETAVYLGTVLSTRNNFGTVHDCIKKLNYCCNHFMAELGSLSTIVNNQYCCAFYGSQLWPLWHNSVNSICAKWRTALRRIWHLPYATHCALVPLIAECIPRDVSLDIRFIKFYRNASRSDNDVIKYLANRAILSYESPMGTNIRFIMSKYVINIHDMISLPLNTLRCTCINISNNYHNSMYAHICTNSSINAVS